MNNWEVIYYVSAGGDNPVKSFLDKRPRSKLKALRILSNVREFGISSIVSHIKKLSGTPLWEIRILGEDSTRILYVTKQQKQVLLLHAFVKKTNKTPRKEIDIALARLLEVNRLT